MKGRVKEGDYICWPSGEYTVCSIKHNGLKRPSTGLLTKNVTLETTGRNPLIYNVFLHLCSPAVLHTFLFLPKKCNIPLNHNCKLQNPKQNYSITLQRHQNDSRGVKFGEIFQKSFYKSKIVFYSECFKVQF